NADFVLHERVRHEIGVRSQLRAAEARSLPDIFLWRGPPSEESLQHVLPAVAPPRSPHFPETGVHHLLERVSRVCELGSVKNRLTRTQFLQYPEKLRIGRQAWFHHAPP